MREFLDAEPSLACADQRNFGCDRDDVAIAAARSALAEFAGRHEIRRGSFAELDRWVPAESCDGVLLDLGVSSPQLTDAGRGFSFQTDGPLDMRMDRRQALTAAELVNDLPADELARLFWEFGDERAARRIAQVIAHDRRLRRFETTKKRKDFGLLLGVCRRIADRGAYSYR